MAANGQRDTVVLIEPDSAVRQAITLLLKGDNWKVSACKDGSTWPPLRDDAICLISEVTLPDATPEDILKQAAETKLPVVFIGDSLSPQSAVDLIHKGAVDYLERPFLQSRLLNLMKTISGHSQARDGMN